MFEIGKEVVCIRTHSQGIVKEGEIYPLKGIKPDWCHCNIEKNLLLDIGLKITKEYVRCPKCEYRLKSRGIGWVSSVLFAPLDDFLAEEIRELTEPLEQVH